MKVLHINTHADGGAAKVGLALHSDMLRRGVNSKFLVGVHQHRAASPVVRVYDTVQGLHQRALLEFKKLFYKIRRNYHLSRVPTSSEWFSFPWSPYDLTAFAGYEEADVIHLHWVGGFLDYRSFFRKNKKPVIWTLHDLGPISDGTHFETGFPKRDFNALSNKLLGVKKNALKNQNIHWVSLSSKFHEQAQAYELYQQFPQRLIANGVNPTIYKSHDQRLARQILDLPQTEKLAFFIAYPEGYLRKGMRMMKETMKKLENTDIRFVTIGREDVSMHPNCLNLGQVSAPRLLSQLYAAADIYVVPSVEESFGLTVLEALSCGTPVLGFEVGCVPDVIISGQNGWICTEQSAEALSNNLLAAFQQPSLKGETLRSPIIAEYAWERVTEQYLTLYEEVLAGQAHLKSV